MQGSRRSSRGAELAALRRHAYLERERTTPPMILDAARAALTRLPSRPFRGTFLASVGTTLVALVAVWYGLFRVVDYLALPWLDVLFSGAPAWAGGFAGLAAAILAGVGLAVGLAFLIPPVTALVTGLFLDGIAETIEREDYPDDPPGRAVPPLAALVLALKFFGIVLLGNIVALFLLLVPVVNIGAFFVINGYLLGREFFEFAAMRFRSEADAKALRRRHAGTVFAAGLVIAAFVAIPIVNLATPLFAAAMMVHLHKAISAREGA